MEPSTKSSKPKPLQSLTGGVGQFVLQRQRLSLRGTRFFGVSIQEPPEQLALVSGLPNTEVLRMASQEKALGYS